MFTRSAVHVVVKPGRAAGVCAGGASVGAPLVTAQATTIKAGSK